MAVDIFIHECSDKTARLATAEYSPPPLILTDAPKMMRSHISNYKEILGKDDESIKILHSSIDASDEEGSIRKINKKQTQDYGISYFGRSGRRQRRDYLPKQTSEDYVKSNYSRRSGRLPDYGRLWQNREEAKFSTKGIKSTANYR